MQPPRTGACSGPGRLLVLSLLTWSCTLERIPERVIRATSDDTLKLELSVPGDVPSGAPVEVRLEITNISDRAVDLHLTGREIAFDIMVKDAADRTVWRRLSGVATQSILQLKTLMPGESLELSDTWKHRFPPPPGQYAVTAEIPTDAAPLRFGPVSLRIR